MKASVHSFPPNALVSVSLTEAAADAFPPANTAGVSPPIPHHGLRDVRGRR